MEATVKPIDLFMELDQWVQQMRKELPLSRVIRVVSARMRAAEGEVHHMLARGLPGLLCEAGRDLEALHVLDEMIEVYSDDVRFPIKKAELLFYFLDDPEGALRSIDLALKRAYRTLFFRREALGVKARILLQLGRGDQLSEVLEEIMSLQMTKDIPDVGRERDFVDRAPVGLISENVLARYNEFRPKRAGDSNADEPPEYEPRELG